MMSEKYQQLPSYQAVSESLKKVHALSEASEAHALLCALFTGGAEVRIQAWIDALMAEPIQPEDAATKPALEVLKQMYQATKAQFTAETPWSFDLLLPDDEAPFHARIDALAMWSQGFLSGLGLMSFDFKQGSKELQEAMRDLVDLSRVQYDNEVSGKSEEESAYMELVEYTKVAVLLIQSEFGIKSTKQSIH